MASQLRNQRRVDALFRALSSDYLLREQFVTDPAQILTEYVSGERLDPDAAAAANHLVYAVVSNPGLLRWVQSAGAKGKAPTGDEFAGQFAHAVARNGDEATILALVRAAGDPHDRFEVQAGVLAALIAAFGRRGGGVFAGTEMSSPGTEISPGPGTNISPGAVFEGTEMSSPGTEISPGSPGTEMSPGAVFEGTEMSSPGTEISPGSPGTEMSPGAVFEGTEMSSPGTEISPGPGTDMSPGRFGGINLEVTLIALVEFAQELRAAGALNTVRFR
jgi:hypothetical protein